jgi:predicted DNA-binding protein with PD1-like motif
MLKGQVGRICFSRLFKDEELTESVKKRIEESGIKAGVFVLIGSLENVTLGYYDGAKYQTVQINGPLEIASCIGNIAVDEEGRTAVHAHLIVSNSKCEAFGGHLLQDSKVGATVELVIIEAIGVDLKRAFDEGTKLKLLNL